MPGGFEFGGIGRMMMYATDGWRDDEQAPLWWLVDARGPGRLMWSPLYTLRALASLIVRRPDLLHLNVAGRGSTLRKLVLAKFARSLGIATLIHLHDFDYAADLERRSPRMRRAVQAMFQRAVKVVVLGQRDRRTVEDLLGVPGERIVVLHNAVPDPGPPPDRSGRAGPVRILFLGHLDDRKGVPELLAALGLAASRERDWQMVLAGGKEVARFRKVVRDMGLQHRIELPGWLPHDRVRALCRDADVFVLPSHGEGQAMALLEAMSHGLAIVTTPVGAHLEAVRHDVEALIVPPGDVDSLAGALQRLIDSREERKRLGAAARRRYREDFDARRYSQMLKTLYGHLLGERQSS